MKYLIFLLTTFLYFYGHNLQSQNCFTRATQEQVDYMNETKHLRNNVYTDFGDDVIHYIPIQFHIIRNDYGSGITSKIATIAQLEAELTIVNDLYAPNNMLFFQCDTVNYIDDDYYYYTDINKQSSEEFGMTNTHNVVGKINIYYGSNFDGAYASFPVELHPQSSARDLIVIDNNFWNQPTTLAHEIGHYFNLYHTHEGPDPNSVLDVIGLEHPHRWGANKNCGDNIGDELCSTNADPFLDGLVDETTCEYDPITYAVNANSNYIINGLSLEDYNPNTHNIMSYSKEACKDFLTEEQLERVLQTYVCDRSYLFCGEQVMPDLVVTDETTNKYTVKAGKKIYVTSNVKNIGGATTGTHSYMKYYLSNDPIFQADEDTYLKYDKVDTLAANAIGSESQHMRIQSSTPSGVKYILFVADGTEKVIESNEANNVTAIEIIVTSCDDGSDLIVTNQTVSTTTIEAGEFIYLESVVKNIGNETSVNNTRLKYYLSDDDTFGGDTYLYYDYIDQLDSGEENFETVNTRIPENTPTGNYYILWRADATNIDEESNENNNVVVQPIFVTASTGKTNHKEATEILSTQLKANAAPNPFAETTTIEYTLDKRATVFVDVYDATGKKVAQLLEGKEQAAGKQSINFEATDLPDGLYFCQIKIGDQQETIRILLQR